MIGIDNLLLMTAAIVFAMLAIGVLYAIIMFQGNKKETELQLTTKNVLEQVRILYDKNEYALVELLASKYLDRVPSHREVRQYLAKAYYQGKKYNNAIKQCLWILKKDPGNIDVKKLLGDCFIAKDMLGRAIKEYEEVFDKRSRDKDVVQTLAGLYRDTEQTYSAISAYNILSEIADSNDEVARVQSILAELNEEIYDYPAAFEAYKLRLEIYPTDVITNQKLVELYIKLKNHQKAVETLQFMLTFVNDTKVLQWVYEALIEMYVTTEEYEKAIEYSEKLLEIQGVDKFKVRDNIAKFNLKLNKVDSGISILEELVMMSQNGYQVTVELADAYIQKKEYKKALDKYLELLDKATQKEAKSVRLLLCDMYIKWAIEMAEESKFDESYRYLGEAEQYNTLNPEIYYNIANNKILQKNYAESIEFINRALEYDKFKEFHVKYLLMLAEVHHHLNNFFEEKKALTDLLKIDENNAQGLFRVGLMYISQHDPKNAEEYLKHALSSDPDLIQAKYNLALLYETNNKEKAREMYMEILEQDPSNEEAKIALADLSSSDF